MRTGSCGGDGGAAEVVVRGSPLLEEPVPLSRPALTYSSKKESANLKKNIASRLCFAMAVFVAIATTLLSAQQATPSPASGKNMTEE